MFVVYRTKTVPRADCQGMARERCDSLGGNYLLIKSYWEVLMDFVYVQNAFTQLDSPRLFPAIAISLSE